jgi:hypothetical protein
MQGAVLSGLHWASSEAQKSSIEAIANSSGLGDLAARCGNFDPDSLQMAAGRNRFVRLSGASKATFATSKR